MKAWFIDVLLALSSLTFFVLGVWAVGTLLGDTYIDYTGAAAWGALFTVYLNDRQQRRK